MITLSVPTFKAVWPVGAKHHTYEFVKQVLVKVHNKPTTDDYQKIVSLLPGIACGYCDEFFHIGQSRQPIPITNFYDTRQSGANKLLKGYFITIKNS